MNIIKHMEAAFIVALSLAGAAAISLDASAPAQAAAPAASRMAVRADIPVVHVSAKRMTAVEKLQSLALERVAKRA